MKLCYYPDVDLPENARPAVTLGNFDGVHLGHRKTIELLQERAKALASPAVAVTFEPHPVSVVRPEQAPKRILTPELKQEVLAELGLDFLVIIHFTEEFSRIEPDAFVERVLVEKLHVGELVLGGNFRFGRGRAGDLEALKTLGELHGFVVHQVEASSHDGTIISSSRIRLSLIDGDVEEAGIMLGRPFFVQGTVVKGDGRGRLMGFPTANITVDGDVLVGDGVYVSDANRRWRASPRDDPRGPKAYVRSRRAHGGNASFRLQSRNLWNGNSPLLSPADPGDGRVRIGRGAQGSSRGRRGGGAKLLSRARPEPCVVKCVTISRTVFAKESRRPLGDF